MTEYQTCMTCGKPAVKDWLCAGHYAKRRQEKMKSGGGAEMREVKAAVISSKSCAGCERSGEEAGRFYKGICAACRAAMTKNLKPKAVKREKMTSSAGNRKTLGQAIDETISALTPLTETERAIVVKAAMSVLTT